LFDLDGVVVHTEDVHLRAYDYVFRRLDAASQRAGRDAFQRGLPRREVIRSAIPNVGAVEEERLMNEKAACVRQELKHAVLEPAPGVVALLRTLKANGRPTGVVSNSSMAHEFVDSLGLKDCFDVVVGATEALPCKPSAAPYLHALDVLGIPSQPFVAIEDTADGLRSAREAGGTVVLVGASTGPLPKAADFFVPSLADIAMGELFPPIERSRSANTKRR
jgi:HAD superfamily hydrolase (TIGR01509 family)